MCAVIAMAVVISPPLKGLGQSGRIFYFHVPCAWIGALAYIVAAASGIGYLKTRDFTWDCKSASAAQIGLLFTFLATASGAIWAQAAWGKWWNWDPRQSAIFIVLLIYGAYFSLRTSIDSPESRASASAVYSIIAFVAAFFLIFVAPRMPGIESLHPSPVIPSANDEQGIALEVLAVLLASIAAFTALFLWMWRIQYRVAILSRRKDMES